MSTARTHHPKSARTVLSRLKRMYGAPKKPTEGDIVEQIVLAILARNKPLDQAEATLQKFKSYYVDFNELRVTQPGELATHMGPSSSQTMAQARTILAVLKSILNRENTLNLESLKSKSKTELESYFSQIQNSDNYLLASVVLHCCGRQAFPLDEKMLAACKELGLAEGEVDLEGMQAYLERQLRSADSYAFCYLLKQYACRESTRDAGAKKSAAKKKTVTKKKKKAKTKTRSVSTVSRKRSRIKSKK